MLVELARVSTSDGQRLDGAWLPAAPSAVRQFDVDAFVLLHGVAGNFYSGNLFDRLAQVLVEAGVHCLRINTRGHDSISVSWGRPGPQFQGAAYEIVDHCRYDIAAWLEWLAQREVGRVGLLGHSLGAIKAVYSQAHEPHRAVRCVVACSAPRLSYSAFMNSDAQPRFFESLSEAREHVEQGCPQALMLSKFPTPVWITAAGYLDKYGSEERYNILRFVERVPCPLLATYGELELSNGGAAFAGMPSELSSRRRADQSLDIVTLAGADHAYTGVYERLATAVTDWLARTLPAG